MNFVAGDIKGVFQFFRHPVPFQKGIDGLNDILRPFDDVCQRDFGSDPMDALELTNEVRSAWTFDWEYDQQTPDTTCNEHRSYDTVSTRKRGVY